MHLHLVHYEISDVNLLNIYVCAIITRKYNISANTIYVIKNLKKRKNCNIFREREREGERERERERETRGGWGVGGGAGIAQSVEALYFTTELHTASVRVRVQPRTKYVWKALVTNVCQ